MYFYLVGDGQTTEVSKSLKHSYICMVSLQLQSSLKVILSLGENKHELSIS